MEYEIDHLFILTSAGAPEASALLDFGLTEGSANRHTGQGTANRRFFFHNMMLELLWVTDPVEANSPPIRRTHLWERWHHRNEKASPFGICLRPRRQEATDPPFPGWSYRPPYLPDGTEILMGSNAGILSEPLLFSITFGGRPDAAVPHQPLNHRIGCREITAVHIRSPLDHTVSDAMKTIRDAGLVTVEPSDQHMMEIVFDGGKAGQTAGFRPHLPLVVKW